MHRAPRVLAILLCGALSPACATSSPSPSVATISLGPDPEPDGPRFPTPGERLLALLTEDNSNLERVAMSLAGVAEPHVRLAAGPRLVAMAKGVGSEAWRERELAKMAEETEEGTRPPGLPGLRIEQRETQALASIMAAMSHIGGPAIIDYCFAVAEDANADWDRKRLALRVLDRVLPAKDVDRRTRRNELAAHVPPPSWSHGRTGESAAALVASLRRALRVCYQRSLREDPSLRVTARVSLHFDRRGTVTATFSGDRLPPGFERCIQNAVRGARVVDKDGEEISITFTLQPG